VGETNRDLKRPGLYLGRRLLVLCLALDAGVLAWFVTSQSKALTYSRTVEQLLGNLGDPSWFARRLRLEGMLVPDSLRVTDPCRFTFQVQGASGAVLQVRWADCTEPNAVCLAGLPLTLEGSLAREGGAPVFLAERALMRCPGKYEKTQSAAWLHDACTQQPAAIRRLCSWCPPSTW
jgi:hypothetical protein